MSQQMTFWRRVGRFFRGGPAPHDDQTRRDGAAMTNSEEIANEENGPDAAANDAATPGLLARLGRREPSVSQMRDGYQRIVETLDGLQDHFKNQDQRAEQLGEHVAQMVNRLEQLADTGRTQQDHIRSIADNVNQAGVHTAAISESLSQLPTLLQGEAEAVRSMVRHMEVSQESDTQLMHSLQKLSQAVDALSAAGAAQIQTLERLDGAGREQKEALTTLVREQTRRFMIIIVIAAILGLGALAALVTVLALQLSR